MESLLKDHMIHSLDLWRRDHINFAKLLGVLDAQLARLDSAERADYELMREIIDHLREYSDRYHHPREDAALVRLLERVPDLELPINRLLQEHRVIAAAGERVCEVLEQILKDTMLPRESLEMPLALYLTYCRHHANIEEAKLIPLAREVLTSVEREAVDPAVPNRPDPVLGKIPGARSEALRKCPGTSAPVAPSTRSSGACSD